MFHFTTWPDHGVPSAPALLGFWKQVKKETESSGPIVVHCSAGIGRTGTFIGLDYLVDEAKDTKVVNIFQCVRKMRDNRVNMVQTSDQYRFLHEVLLEAISSIDTFYTVDSFKKSLLHGDMKLSVQKRRFQQEFNDLTRLKIQVSERDVIKATLPENKEKNRCLSSCTNRKGFVVTQLPLEHTVIDFWRMVYEQNSHTIVSLTGGTTHNDTAHWPKVGEMKAIGPFTIKHQSTLKSSGGVTEISLTLQTDAVYENMDGKSLTMFVLNNWSEDSGLPSDMSELLLFLDKLERRREETGKSPIIVQCMDGAKYSGLFCVLSNIIEKLKLDKDVDIFVTVRDCSEEYQYCYGVVKEFLRSLDTQEIFDIHFLADMTAAVDMPVNKLCFGLKTRSIEECAVRSCAVLCCAVLELHCKVVYCTLLCCAVLYCTVTVLCCTVLCCTAL
ncbi:receptor-type tyrosine-protein phosphatase epsilon-like [Gigantopelta aegis]|uniref:receptor-type tyrosine-protein phosphatase epsilon-like n=1 Tax=Gigantopelta aegis TaxID=1735272 RepID=UPI001B8890C0|nr:receptor-type tyrosine-protein phosphatase epsilon-like [Gigantopelta aegis]